MIRPETILNYMTLCLLALCGQKASAVDPQVLRSRVDSLERLLPSQNGAERQETWTQLYYNTFDLGQDSLSMQVLDRWMADAHKEGRYWSESVARQNKLIDLYNSGRYDSMRVVADEAKVFCRRHDLMRKYFEAWHLIICSYHVEGKYNTAIREGRRMHDEAMADDNVFGQAMAYFNMGNVYYTMRHFPQAVKAFSESISLLQREDSMELVLLEVYPYYGDALDATKEYGRLDSISHEWHRHVEHVRNGETSMDLPAIEANYYIGRTQALLGLGRKEEARKALAEAAKNVVDKNSYEWIYVVFYQAEIAKLDGDYEKALELNGERLRLCSVIEDKPTLIPVHQQRAEILLAAGRYEEAARMYRRTYELNDSLNTMQTREQLNEMNTLFQVDGLRMENAIQQSRYYTIIAVTVAITLLIILIIVYVFARKLKAKNDLLARSYNDLKLANEKAQEATRMKLAFIRNVSHEIRTPLNIVSGFTQVLRDQGSQLSRDEWKNISDSIEDNSNRMSELVDKMLELSETKALTVIERTDAVTASQIADEAVKLSGITHTTAPEAPASLVRFEMVSLLSQEVELTTNQVYANRALRHLLENARKFTRQGRVTLSLSENTQTVIFTVEDTGIGVPKEARERIFGEFVKLDDYSIGSGIGLPLARSIARMLGGDIVLDDQYTGGARFVMTLPKKMSNEE